jgi:DNA-binding response OmpR family regulator
MAGSRNSHQRRLPSASWDSLPDIPDALTFALGDMELDPEHRTLRKGDRSVYIPTTLVRILLLFSKYPNRVIAEERLRGYLYGDGEYRGDAVIRVHMTRCRASLRKVGSNSKFKTHRAAGWEFYTLDRRTTPCQAPPKQLLTSTRPGPMLVPLGVTHRRG